MQPRIVGRDVAGLAHHFVYLHLAAITDHHTSSDTAAIALRAFQPYLQPMIRGRSIVAQQGWRFILIHDHHVQVAIVVEISEAASAALMPRRVSRSSLFAQFGALPVS